MTQDTLVRFVYEAIENPQKRDDFLAAFAEIIGANAAAIALEDRQLRWSRLYLTKTCRWTPEVDEVLRSAWAQGGLRAARRAIREYQPTWTIHSIRKRAAALSLCKPRPAPWSDADVNSMLWAIDSNASLGLIAERMGRSVGAVRHKLRALGYTVESLGGYKVKDVSEMLSVPIGRVRYWAAEKLLLTKGGRITESSFSKFLVDHPKRIPFDSLSPQMQSWLVEMGYPAPGPEPKAATAAQ